MRVVRGDLGIVKLGGPARIGTVAAINFPSNMSWSGFRLRKSVLGQVLVGAILLSVDFGCTREVEKSADDAQDTGLQSSFAQTASQASSGTTSVDTSQSVEQGPDTGAPVTCFRDLDCTDPSAPACDLGTQRCVRCTHSQIHCQDTSAPHCSSIDGIASCEPCTLDAHCSEQRSHCVRQGPGASTRFRCTQCRTHRDCEDPANARCDDSEGAYRCVPCNEVEGQCPRGNTCLMTEPGRGRCTRKVIYAGGTSDCEHADGSQAHPFCSMMDALEHVDSAVPTTLRFPYGDDTPIGLLIPDNVQLSLVGRGNFLPQLFVGKGSEVSVHRLAMESGVLLSDDSRLYLDAVEMGAAASLVVGNGGQAWVERSVFKSDASLVGLPLFDLRGGELKISSSVIAGYRIGSADPVGEKLALFRLDQSSNLNFDHVTIADNDLAAMSPLFRCLDPLSSVTLQNSIVLDLQQSSQLQCTSSQLQATRVLSDHQELIGQGSARWEQGDWRVYFRNPDQGDYGLKSAEHSPEDPTWAQMQSLGQWSPGQTPRDLDGQPWKRGPGYVGADQAETGSI